MTNKEAIKCVAKEIGGKVYYDYSGRNMFGKTCIGISCKYYIECIEAASKYGIVKANWDQLGMDYIVYWPSLNPELICIEHDGDEDFDEASDSELEPDEFPEDDES